ncbi:MAG: hypothetical protein LQ337_002604 [Flavoplaca oasis]|nr:MAG: hypothetical protein LQ337_002604 [Flavoplaca oasis]
MPARKNTKSTKKMEQLMNSIAEDDELDVLQVAGCIEALVYRTYDDAFHAGKEGLTIFQGMYDLGELRGRAAQLRIAKEQELSSVAVQQEGGAVVDEDTDMEDTTGRETTNDDEGMAPGKQEGNLSIVTPSGAVKGTHIVTAVNIPTKTPEETPEETRAKEKRELRAYLKTMPNKK